MEEQSYDNAYDNIQSEDEIVDDMDFIEHVKKAKKLLDIGDIDELKQQQAEMLRVELSKIIKYVMDKVQSEREAEQQEQREQQEQQEQQAPPQKMAPPVLESPQPPQPLQLQQPLTPGGGYKKKNKSKGSTKRVKGGAQNVSTPMSGAMDGNRILNTGGLTDANHDPQKVAGSPEIVIAGSLHRAFSAGNQGGISSTQGLPFNTMNTLLPSYGTVGGSMKSKKKEKTQKK